MQQGLRYMALIILIQNKADQLRTVVAVFIKCRQLAHYIISVWRFVYLELETNIMRLHFEVLNHPGFIVSEGGSGRYMFRLNGYILVYFQKNLLY